MDKEFPTIVCQMEEDEGGRDRSSGKKNNNKKNRGAGGASAACLRLYISPGFGNQTQEKPTASKHTLGASHALPIFRQRKHSMMILPHLFMFFSFFSLLLFFPCQRRRAVFRFAGTACRARGSVHGSLDPSPYNQPTVWSAGPGVPPAHHG